jgi:hypothetical protein
MPFGWNIRGPLPRLESDSEIRFELRAAVRFTVPRERTHPCVRIEASSP